MAENYQDLENYEGIEIDWSKVNSIEALKAILMQMYGRNTLSERDQKMLAEKGLTKGKILLKG